MFFVINKGKIISYCVALFAVVTLIAVSTSVEKNNKMNTMETMAVNNIIIKNTIENRNSDNELSDNIHNENKNNNIKNAIGIIKNK